MTCNVLTYFCGLLQKCIFVCYFSQDPSGSSVRLEVQEENMSSKNEEA